MKIVPLILLLLASNLWISCSSMENIDTSTVAGQYQLGEMYEKNERYQEAIIQFTEIKNKHPYSRFATMAELKAADIHFKREAYSEAKLAYQIFRDYHPTHARGDYVIYQIALSAYHLLPESIDKDLSESKDAIYHFDQLARLYPQSKFLPDAKVKKAEILKKLAEKELYIADFYFKKEHFVSALQRYEKVLFEFPNLGYRAKALYGASVSAFESDQSPKGKTYLTRLYQEYPQSSETSQLRSKESKYGLR